MAIGSLIIGGGALVIAAEIATWCFKAAAKGERQYRRDFVRNERSYRRAITHREREYRREVSQRERAERREIRARERAERREIERETRRQLAQEAYEQRGAWLDMLTESMKAVWEMRTRTRELRGQFQEIVRANQLLIKTSPLTFQQQEAIRDCIFHLERGIARLHAYSGPYLQEFIDSISDAKRAALKNEFIEPDMPEAVLPDDFPVVGDNLRLSPEEAQTLLRSGGLALGSSQTGRLQKTPPSAVDLCGEVDAFVEDYDRDSGSWKLSLARGAIASASIGDTARTIEATLLSPSRGGFRAAWHSPYTESIELFMPFALADPSMRSAPWGTRLYVFVHQCDYRMRRIVVGQRAPAPPDDLAETLVVEPASAGVRETIEKAFEVSPSTFWLTEGHEPVGRSSANLFMRVATGEEFPVTSDDRHGVLRIGEQTGCRLGNVNGAICRSYVGLLFADTSKPPASGTLTAADFLQRIRRRLDEQEELQRVFQEESLETRKYQLLLEAELEAGKASSRVVLRYSTYQPAMKGEEGAETPEVCFLLESPPPKTDLNNYAAEVLPHSSHTPKRTRLCGFVRALDRERQAVTCSFSDELLRLFLDREVPDSGTLECSYVDVDTQRQVRALDQFRNVSFLQGKSAEDREAFRNLRRVLLGLSQPAPDVADGADDGLPLVSSLNAEQQRAVRLINSSSPLTLVLGPPGTGKTDTIAIALEVFLRRSPDARVAVVSQANVAVDEALKKLKGRYPECDIVRHVSAHAADSVMDSSKDITQHARREDFIRQLASQPVLPAWASALRDQFRHACKDERYLTHRVIKALVHSSAVYGCTLSMLGRLSLGAPLFDLVVVDEAAKASLPECLIAALSAKRLVLVGDHHQLLPFVDERVLERAGPSRADQQAVQELWNNSLFKRMWNQAGEGIKVQLTTQYRSRSGIREAISNLFYDKRLSPGRTDESSAVPFPCSLVWVDTKGHYNDQIPVRKSLVNEREVDAIFATLDMLAYTLPKPAETSVAVISFYGEQRALLDRVFREAPVTRAFASCEARTVDASQGGQWDVVLLSLVRCDGGSSFVGNANRLNVALSRARELAVVVGSFRYALNDRNPESKLGPFANYIQAQKGRGVWICAPGPRGGIAPGFGFKGVVGGGHGYRR